MPFDLTSPALGGDAYSVIVDYVDTHLDVVQRDEFYTDSGRSREAWLSMKRGSHGDYAALIDSFYRTMGRRDPELLYPVYRAVANAKDSPVRNLAKGLGNAPAVVEASAYISALLNNDSRIRVHNLSATGATIQQTVLGPTDLFYAEQVYGAMGYYKGIAPLFDLEEIGAELRMLSMPLHTFLARYAPDFAFERDDDGNYYSGGKLFAEARPYAQTERAIHGLPEALWQMRDGTFFLGNPKQLTGEERRLRLDEIIIVQTTRDLETEGVSFVREGVFFGGIHPAPTNVYDLRWEGKSGFRQSAWLFLSGMRARLFDRGETIAHMALLADKEANRRGKAEEENRSLVSQLERHRETMAAETLAAHQIAEERRIFVERIEAEVHDYKNIYGTGLSLRVDEEVLPILRLGEHFLRGEEKERLFARVGGDVSTLESHYRRTMAGEDAEDIIPCDSSILLDVYQDLVDIAYTRRTENPFWSWLIDTHKPSFDAHRDFASQSFAQLVQTLGGIRRTNQEVLPVQLDTLLEGELQHWELERRNGVIDSDIQPVQIIGQERALRMAAFNLLDNAVLAARKAPRPRVSLTLGSEQGFAVLRGFNSGPAVARDIATMLGVARREAYSTRPEGKGGVGTKFIAETALAHGGGIFYEPREEGGLKWELRLPLAIH